MYLIFLLNIKLKYLYVKGIINNKNYRLFTVSLILNCDKIYFNEYIMYCGGG